MRVSHQACKTNISTLPGLATLLVLLAVVDEAARPGFEDHMRSAGTKDFSRSSSGRYSNAVLQWCWEDWRVLARAGVPA